jgi:SP family myo-inositol transporter-like MFS transporter 13
MVSAIGGFLFGYDTGVIGGANQYIEDEMNLNPLTEETVVSIAILGAVFGAIGAGPSSDHFGRKKTIMVADVVFFFGAVFMGIAPNVGVLIFGRFIVGLGVGIAAMVVPVYLAEASPPAMRGTLVATNNAFITGG